LNHVDWKVQEVFYFPESFGVPSSASRIDVKPQVEFQQLNGVCSLHGVYHIAANVAFQPGESQHHGTSEWISIEDLDVSGENGYFEYAVPLFVELPPTYVHGDVQPTIHLAEVHASVTDDQTLKVEWDVKVSYEPLQPPESPSVDSSSSNENSTNEESLVSKEDIVLPFFLGSLKDEYSIFKVK